MTTLRATVPGPVAADAPSGTNATAGAGRIHAAFERAKAEGRAALIPYVVAGYPDAETMTSRARFCALRPTISWNPTSSMLATIGTGSNHR